MCERKVFFFKSFWCQRDKHLKIGAIFFVRAKFFCEYCSFFKVYKNSAPKIINRYIYQNNKSIGPEVTTRCLYNKCRRVDASSNKVIKTRFLVVLSSRLHICIFLRLFRDQMAPKHLAWRPKAPKMLTTQMDIQYVKHTRTLNLFTEALPCQTIPLSVSMAVRNK
jgi:hypothetical protein